MVNAQSGEVVGAIGHSRSAETGRTSPRCPGRYHRAPQQHLSPARQSRRRFCPGGGFPVSRWGGGYGHRLPESLEKNAVIAGVLPAVKCDRPDGTLARLLTTLSCHLSLLRRATRKCFLGTLLFYEVPRGVHKHEAVSATRLPTVRWREEQD